MDGIFGPAERVVATEWVLTGRTVRDVGMALESVLIVGRAGCEECSTLWPGAAGRVALAHRLLDPSQQWDDSYLVKEDLVKEQGARTRWTRGLNTS